MSYSNQGGAGGLGGGNFGVNIIQQLLSAIQQSLNSLVTVITDITQILASNNTWTGNNTFNNTTTFNAAVDVNGPTILTGTTQLIGNTTFSGGTASFTDGASFDPPPTINIGALAVGTFLPAGAIYKSVNGAGVGNGADTTDDVLYQYVLPANSFDANERTVIIEAFGGFANNAHNKTVKLWFGTSTVATTGVVTTASGGWWLKAIVVCANALSTGQISTGFGLTGTTVTEPLLVVPGGQVTTAPIVIEVTGASPTTGAANDVVGYGMIVQFLN